MYSINSATTDKTIEKQQERVINYDRIYWDSSLMRGLVHNVILVTKCSI